MSASNRKNIGGPLSHGSIVAREYGILTVLGMVWPCNASAADRRSRWAAVRGRLLSRDR
jgi:phosphoenolpyruvate-protein kinase (PTS system EI component)